jgi:cell division protein FtsB
MKYGNRSIWKKIVYSPTVLFILIILFILISRSAWNIYSRTDISADKLEQSRSELNKIKERKAELEARISRLSNDEGLEAEIRSKYRAVKSGEKVAVIVDENNPTTTDSTTTTTDQNTEPNLFETLFKWR